MHSTQTRPGKIIARDGVEVCVIPRATYRLQVNSSFNLKAVLHLVPYLEKLGISHVYISPITKATPGSTHGYDLVNHKMINPEIGTMEDLYSLHAELKKRNMSLLLDIVPNHMGTGKHNSWWQGLLENGENSRFARYFDVDWSPVKPELKGKMTLPILGESYGSILKSGQLKLKFNEHSGSLVIFYYEHELPINPITYPEVLSLRLDELERRLGADSADLNEYKSILSALNTFQYMHPIGFNDPLTETSLQKQRLANLCLHNGQITEFIKENTALYDVDENDKQSVLRLHNLLEHQVYRLVYWRVANDEINYRRFFDINSLAAVRTEEPSVFAEMHELLFNLIKDGIVSGVRIDHPDGLFNPTMYFTKLQKAAASVLELPPEAEAGCARPLYIVVEKILAQVETLEDDWLVHGTTGYDFMNDVGEILINGHNEADFSRIYSDFTGQNQPYDELKRACKKLILDVVLASELNVLAHRLSQLAESSFYFRDLTLNSLRNALRDVVMYFPVYRTYVTPQKVDKTARQFVDWAVGRAKKNAPMINHSVYDFIRDILLLNIDPNLIGSPSGNDPGFQENMEIFAMKFQQFTGPVMAKAVEDTLFYRYARFIALNEVGGEPERMGSTLAAFHQRNERRQERFPHTLLATATHDTKRSEDVRARLAPLSEIPAIWEQKVQLWARMNRGKKLGTPEEPLPDTNEEYFLYQTLVGALPLSMDNEHELEEFKTRILDYMQKAAKESKKYTSWLVENTEYERALTEFIKNILTPSTTNTFISDLTEFAHNLARVGLINSLIQTGLKLTCPGVPDIYQGTELWDFSLVDPDNRRPVDFEQRDAMLDQILENTPVTGERKVTQSWFAEQGLLKLQLIHSLLEFRMHNDSLFKFGNYKAVQVEGNKSEHIIAFSRTYENRHIIVVAPRLFVTLADIKDEQALSDTNWHETLCSGILWGGTSLILSETAQGKTAREVITGKTITLAEKLPVHECFNSYPISVLEVIDE